MTMGANEACVNELVNHLKENIEELNTVYLEWPNHNEPLTMPCATVRTIGNPIYTHQMPTLKIHDNGVSQYYVGSYDLVLHIDLWAEYKQTRGDLMERVFDLFNKQFQELGKALGISLPLADHYNVIARYDITGYNYLDSEETSQRDEWRAKITVDVNFPRVLTKNESAMEQITLENDVSSLENDNDTSESLIIE